MDETTKTSDAFRSGSAATRHRFDSAGANRSDLGQREIKPSYDGPRAEMASGTAAVDPRVEFLGFDEALQVLRRGGRVARKGWNGKNQFIQIAAGASAYGRDLNSAPVNAHLLFRTAEGDLIPWTASQTDLLAFDWCLVREEKVLVYGLGTNADATGNGADRVASDR